MKLLFPNFENSWDCGSVGRAPMAHPGRPDLAPQHPQKARLGSLHLCSPGWAGSERQIDHEVHWPASLASLVSSRSVRRQRVEMNVIGSGASSLPVRYLGAVLESRILKQAHNVMDSVVAFPFRHFFMPGSYFIAGQTTSSVVSRGFLFLFSSGLFCMIGWYKSQRFTLVF